MRNTFTQNPSPPHVRFCYRITAFGPEFESYPTLSKCKMYDGISKHAYSNNDNTEIKVDRLYNAYPNPFNPTTKIRFDLAENSNVEISVYNILGSKLVEIIDKKGLVRLSLMQRNFHPAHISIKWKRIKK